MRLTLPVPPSSNSYWKMWRGRMVVSAEARRYKQGVKLRALTEGHRKPLAGPVVLTVTFYRARKAGDLSNRLKIMEDALEGIAFLNDSQIVEIHAHRLEDPDRPRMEVRIEAAE